MPLLFLTSNSQVQFKPGQWLDVHVPGISKAGGFTITSAPSLAITPSTSGGDRYLELAIKSSPDNQTAAFLFSPERDILNTELKIRVGGSFVWPPPQYVEDSSVDEEGTQKQKLKRAVFVASGMGVNPLMSILSHIAETAASQNVNELPSAGTRLDSKPEFEITFLYGVREEEDPSSLTTTFPARSEAEKPPATRMLFLDRIVNSIENINRNSNSGIKASLQLYITSPTSSSSTNFDKGSITHQYPQDTPLFEFDKRIPFQLHQRRITKQDVMLALGPAEQRKNVVCYVCGIPSMTDELVEAVSRPEEGMSKGNIMFEKWW